MCADPNVDYFPQKTVCWATAARRVAQRRWDKRIEEARPDMAGYLPNDGVTIWVSPHDLEPDGDFLARPSSSLNEQTEGGDPVGDSS